MKEEFKNFVRRNPKFVNYVRNNKITWQQLYEIYDLYGENNSVWDSFKENDSNPFTTIKEFLNLFKGIDVKKIQSTLSTLSKAIDAFKDKDDNNIHNYEERPKYKYFED